MPDDVAEYIASNVTQSVREIEGVVVSLVAHATVLNRDITVDLARRVMSNAVKIKRRQVNFEIVTEAVASYYNISSDLIFTSEKPAIFCCRRFIVRWMLRWLQSPLRSLSRC